MPQHSRILNRRQMLIGAAATSVIATSAGALQTAVPTETPSASPAASPQPTALPPTPTPLPVPNHKLAIVREPIAYGDPVIGGNINLFIQSSGLTDGNPAVQSQDMTLLMSVFEGLVRINPTTMEAEPGLATMWSWSADGRVLTFVLRNDVRWHDGSAFTATDAAFTCMVYRDDFDSRLAGLYGLVEDAVAIDDHTLQIIFAAPDGAFVFNAASLPILQAHMYQDLWDEFAPGEKTLSRQNLSIGQWIGTGPWKIEHADADRVQLGRFDEYWDGAAHCDSLTLIVQDDPAAQIKAWKRGEVDVLPTGATQLPDVWNEQGRLFVAPSATAMFAAFNFHNPANATSIMMVDQSLRAALTMAVNRDRYADDVFFGFINEHAVGTMTQPWLHDNSLKNPAYDPIQARKVLEDGGWHDWDGDGIVEDADGNIADLFLIVRDDERPELLLLLDQLIDDWAAIGVRLTIQHLWPEVLDDRWVENRDYDLIAYSLVNYPAFNEYDLYGSNWDIRFNLHGWNPGGYYNPGVDEAIDQWFAATGPAEMKTAATTIQRLTNEDLFGIWFGFPQDLTLVRGDIQGFSPDMFLYAQSAHRWWRDDASPLATPVATPGATPVAKRG